MPAHGIWLALYRLTSHLPQTKQSKNHHRHNKKHLCSFTFCLPCLNTQSYLRKELFFAAGASEPQHRKKPGHPELQNEDEVAVAVEMKADFPS